jgi:protein involved in plasmid replication-relaxation
MPRKLPPRDVELLRIVGRFRMLSRAQVKRWLFAGLSDPIVTRCIDRLASRGYLGVERLHGNGIQVLWLCRAGKELLIDNGMPAVDLFAATRPATAKDFEHTLAMGDVAAWLATKNPAPDELLPAWAVQRVFGGVSKSIPDLVAIWRDPTGFRPVAAMLVEVDLGTEPIKSVLGPKLENLTALANNEFRGAAIATIIFVLSERRRDSIQRLASESDMLIHIRLLNECRGGKC